MRPRVFPAEDKTDHRLTSSGRPASMRPRVFPAEDYSARRELAGRTPRFNEAAGIPRGRLGASVVKTSWTAASMRPRVFPAEDKKWLGM